MSLLKRSKERKLVLPVLQLGSKKSFKGIKILSGQKKFHFHPDIEFLFAGYNIGLRLSSVSSLKLGEKFP
jgi:hypothetical protein